MTYLGSPEAVLLVDEEVIAMCKVVGKVVDCVMIKILSPGRGLYTAIFTMTQQKCIPLLPFCYKYIAPKNRY